MSAEKRQALRRVGRAATKATLAAEQRNASILAALDLASIREVAVAAELSAGRIHQIKHGR
jgi:hypothetical protein